MRYSRETTASVAAVMQHARNTFGPSGLGLRLTSVGLLEATFAGATGTVDIIVRPLRTGVNQVKAASQAFDDEIASFLRDLPAVSVMSQLRRTLRSKIRPRVKP